MYSPGYGPECPTAKKQMIPCSPTDPFFKKLIAHYPHCCEKEWDYMCKRYYNKYKRQSQRNYKRTSDGDPLFPVVIENPSLPLIHRLMQVEKFREMYLDIIEELTYKYFNIRHLHPLIQSNARMIRPYVQSDPNYFYPFNYFDKDLKEGNKAPVHDRRGTQITGLIHFIRERSEEVKKELRSYR